MMSRESCIWNSTNKKEGNYNFKNILLFCYMETFPQHFFCSILSFHPVAQPLKINNQHFLKITTADHEWMLFVFNDDDQKYRRLFFWTFYTCKFRLKLTFLHKTKPQVQRTNEVKWHEWQWSLHNVKDTTCSLEKNDKNGSTTFW